MQTTTARVQGRVPVTILAPHGNIDGTTYQQLIDDAQQVVAGGARDILLDLSNVPYISSAGLVALHSIAALTRGDPLPDAEAGWAALHSMDDDREMGYQQHLKLLNPQPRVTQVLQTVGFNEFLKVFTDRDEAVASF